MPKTPSDEPLDVAMEQAMLRALREVPNVPFDPNAPWPALKELFNREYQRIVGPTEEERA